MRSNAKLNRLFLASSKNWAEVEMSEHWASARNGMRSSGAAGAAPRTGPLLWYSALGLLVLLLTAGVDQLAASPSSAEPENTFAIRGGPEAEELCKQAMQHYQQAEAVLTRLEAAHGEGRLSKTPRQSFVELYLNIVRLDRLAKRLILAREPAGEDLRLRAGDLRNRMQQLLAEYLNTPGLREALARDYPKLRRESQTRSRIVPKLAQLVDRGKWQQAEQALYQAVDPLDAQCVGYDSATRATVLGPFAEAMATIGDHLYRVRQQQGMEALAELRRREAPATGELTDLLERAAAELEAGGKTSWEGQPIHGPELLAKLADRWEQEHLKAIHCLALDWARGDRTGLQQQEELETTYRQATAELAAAMGRVMTADTARLHGDQLRTAYVAYLEKAAALAVRVDDPRFTSAIARAVEQMAARSPELHKEVLAYRQATSELLRWRKRFATDRARALQGGFTPAEQLAGAALVACSAAKESGKPVPVNVARAELQGPAPQLVAKASEVLVGQSVLLVDLEGLPSERPAVTSHYRSRIYGWFRIPDTLVATWNEQVSALEADLLVDDRSPPLSLEAAMALVSARQHRLAAAGGKISKFAVEAVVSRFARLPLSGARLVPLGRLPAESLGSEPLRQIVFQMELEPVWMQHACFAVEAEALR